MRPSRMALYLVIGGAIGAILGGTSNTVPFGIVSGVFVAWPLGLAIETRRRRWLAVVVLHITFLISWWTAGAVGLGVVVFSTFITLFISGAVLRDIYDGNEWHAFIHHVKILTGLFRGIQIVSEGRSVVPPAGEQVLGPRVVVIRPNTAVITEAGTRQTHTLGPGIHITRPFEYVKHIFDLSIQNVSVSISDLRTRDHLEASITLSILVGIQSPLSIRTGEKSMNDPTDTQFASFRQSLERIYDLHRDWKQATISEVESQVRSYAAGLNLDHLTDSGRYQELADIAVRRTNSRVRGWGIRVDRAIVTRIEPARSVSAKMEEQWADGLRRQAVTDNELSEAKAWASALQVIATGYQYARSQNMPQDAISRIVLLRTLERMTEKPGIGIHLSAAMISEISALRQSLGFAR